MRHFSSVPLAVEQLDVRMLEHSGIYRRNWKIKDGQFIDTFDQRPFSTEFAFTRFLVPALCQWRGWAIFCDSDFLFRRDIADLWHLRDDEKAVLVVQHDHVPQEKEKSDGRPQSTYWRKNWSSMVLWNCAHASNRMLVPYMVNGKTGQYLHSFSWLRDDEIGALPMQWNWLEGQHPKPPAGEAEPCAVHFTRGTPDKPGYARVDYADEWRAAAYALGIETST